MRATASVDALVDRASADGFTSLALTDRNGLYGAVSFSKRCHTDGIKPILGVTFNVTSPGLVQSVEEGGRGQVTLLATDSSGYRSLCRLSSALLGDPRRVSQKDAAITWDELRVNRDGLLCLEGGRRGYLEAFLRAEDEESAKRYLASLVGLFQENCYLSLEIHGSSNHDVPERIVALGRQFGLPTVAVQPVYSLRPEEGEKLKLLAAIDHNCSIDNVPIWALPNGGKPDVDLHWLSPGEMVDRFAGFPDALERVGEIVQRCEPTLPGGDPIWPAVELPDDKSPEQTLVARTHLGLGEKYGTDISEAIQGRVDHELERINAQGFAPLFLVVADIVRFAREAEIPVSTRGSVANSLVAFCLGITSVDPFENDLLFERFLNPARKDLPDIDLDFCSRRRDEVLNYARETHGEDRTALVATINTMQPKSAVRETAKAYGFPESKIKRLTARLPRRWHPDPRRRDRRSLEDFLRELDDPLERAVVQAGHGIVGQPRHLSVHPGGVVFTPGPLTDHVPFQWAPKGFLITQFDHEDLEAIGLPKLDLLGIRALTVLSDASDLVRKHHDIDIQLERIPLLDAPTGELLSSGETIGVFQCESEGAQRTLRQLQAQSVQDLAVANAFFKPGPATGGMARAFVRRYRGEEEVTYLHPSLEPILGRTKGVLIFQEQILRLATEIAGLSWEEADYLRRGMSKFRPDEMDAMRARFQSGCMRSTPRGPGFTRRQAEQLWEQVEAFAGYGFNQGHATAYAMVSYRSAYLKAHWPEAFFCARLADHGGYHHPAIYMAEARRLGIDVRPPHINHSGRRFTLTYEGNESEKPQPVLWMGLDQVRDLHRKSIEAIQRQRERAPFEGARDLMGRVRLQEREVTHLIQCGALDGLIASRSQALAEADRIRRAGTPRQIAFDFVEDESIDEETHVQRLNWERTLLGIPVSVSPLELVENGLHDVLPLRDLTGAEKGRVSIVGYKLPGWTGGPSVFFGDGETYVRVRFDESISHLQSDLEAWAPVKCYGQWCVDEWGSSWFQIVSMTVMALANAK